MINLQPTYRQIKLFLFFSLAILMVGMSSCFTGIESTKKISLSREDKKKATPTPEEEFFSGIMGIPLKDWKKNREFIATDDRLLLVYENSLSSFLSDSITIKGHPLFYEGTQIKLDAAGEKICSIVFTDGVTQYYYTTGKSPEEASLSILSSNLPLLIDNTLVNQAKEKILGKQLYTLSNLWYDKNENKIRGKKFIEVTVTDVKPGNEVFPLFIELTTKENEVFYMFMNLGNAGNESRSFHNLFSLTDLKKKYPNISDEFWNLICNGSIKEGMTKQECKLALGNPIDISSGHDYSQTLDIWTYENGKILWFEDGLLIRFKG